jgi:hypothetical protein
MFVRDVGVRRHSSIGFKGDCPPKQAAFQQRQPSRYG